MAFFHAQAPIIQPIQPHHDHSHSTSGSIINDELDAETTAQVAKFTIDGLTDDQWLSIVVDAKLAKTIEGALVNDAAYPDAFITAEGAAELLYGREALPVSKNCQTQLEHPIFFMNPELTTVYVWMIFFRQFVFIEC
jgi:hypothetical protein